MAALHHGNLLMKMTKERYFEIQKGIMLSFLTARDQYDELIEPGQGQLMFNGHAIHWVIDGEQRESITVNWAIQFWLDNGCIIENSTSGAAADDA
jgi:hypothetical protein